MNGRGRETGKLTDKSGGPLLAKLIVDCDLNIFLGLRAFWIVEACERARDLVGCHASVEGEPGGVGVHKSARAKTGICDIAVWIASKCRVIVFGQSDLQIVVRCDSFRSRDQIELKCCPLTDTKFVG